MVDVLIEEAHGRIGLIGASETINNPNSTLANGSSTTYRYWTLVLVIFPILTVFGNALVVVSVYKFKTLQTITNYFIVSLAVADLFVAVFVMPLAVYVEIVIEWRLGDPFCDAWIAADVMGCTASILNLAAISVDRFVAVTEPIKYSKHKNTKRFYIMLTLAWLMSFSIAAPITLGVNYSAKRDTTKCLLYNADFIIYSSMGSFYIPAVVMLILYGKILLVLWNRSRLHSARKKRIISKRQRDIVENNRADGEMRADDQTLCKESLFTKVNDGYAGSESRSFVQLPAIVLPDGASTTSVSPVEDSAIQLPRQSDDSPSPSALVLTNLNVVGKIAETSELLHLGSGNSTEEDTQTSLIDTSSSSKSKRKFAKLSRKASTKINRARKWNAKLNFKIKSIQHNVETRVSSKREKKATKTLAIVIGVFLVCWVPFFTVNIMSAICIRYDLINATNSCNLDPIIFSTFVWLGYINSFLNPAIYTIFNAEFRKAFYGLLMDPCRKRNR